MKQILAVLFILMLLLSACGAKEKETPSAGTAVPENTRTETPAAEASPTYSEQDVLFPPADHPPYAESDGGSEWETAFGMARSEALNRDYFAFWDYFDAHPESALKEHCAGAYTGDANDFRFYILLDDPEDQACLEEIAGIGLKTDYQIRQGTGTEARLNEVKAEIDAKLKELQEKKQNGTIDKDAAELLATYKPDVCVFRDCGDIAVILSCKCIWYGSTGAEQEADRAKAISLFEKYVGKYDVVVYGYPV